MACVATVLFWDHVWQIGSELPRSTRAASAVSSFDARHEGDPSANNLFLEWARKEMLAVAPHGRGTYYMEPASVLEEPRLGQWSTYVLLPERATSQPSEADSIVFYGVSPILTADQGREFGEITEYSPGYALALRSNAR